MCVHVSIDVSRPMLGSRNSRMNNCTHSEEAKTDKTTVLKGRAELQSRNRD